MAQTHRQDDRLSTEHLEHHSHSSAKNSPSHAVELKFDLSKLSVWLNHAKGTLIGNCVGDAIGLSTEFMTRKEAKKCYGNIIGKLEIKDRIYDGHRGRWAFGDWTDDSDQMILIMQSLTLHNKVDPVDFGKRLLNWAEFGFKELGDMGGNGLGRTTWEVLYHREFRDNPHEAARDVWETVFHKQAAPNGGVMRTSVLGVFDYLNEEAVIKNTIDMCMVTHSDPRCQASCVAVTTAIAKMLRHFMMEGNSEVTSQKLNEIIQHSLDQATSVLVKASEKFNIEDKFVNEHINELERAIKVTDLKELRLDEDGKIGYTYKTLGAAFWALKQNNFRYAIETITMEAGDADTNCAAAGALLGCKLGYKGIPESWRHEVGSVDRLSDGSYEKPIVWLRPKINEFLLKVHPEITPLLKAM